MNIPDDDIEFQLTITVEQARAYLDGHYEFHDLDTAIDTAQAPVFTDEKQRTFIIIEVTK